MKKNIPLYEIIFILAAILAISCIVIVSGPAKTYKENLKIQKQTLEEKIFADQPLIKQMNTWQEELDELKAKGDLTSIPDYDNIDNVIAEMNAIFESSGTTAYSISHGDITCENNIVTRNISISFKVESYDVLKQKVEAVHNSQYKYQITDISISNSNGVYRCEMKIVAYEYSASGEIN